jgi:hypothetical protein
MDTSRIIEAFDRAKDRVREAWSADEVVQILRDLETFTLDQIGQAPEARIEVGNLKKWP